ncbi:hypothetical protein N0V90_011637 [Kalmusia sp. IMI 367209]|nr:hypothetical protein N0V90_011637 [Kalmusia sp. IMI 367209]
MENQADSSRGTRETVARRRTLRSYNEHAQASNSSDTLVNNVGIQSANSGSVCSVSGLTYPLRRTNAEERPSSSSDPSSAPLTHETTRSSTYTPRSRASRSRNNWDNWSNRRQGSSPAGSPLRQQNRRRRESAEDENRMPSSYPPAADGSDYHLDNGTSSGLQSPRPPTGSTRLVLPSDQAGVLTDTFDPHQASPNAVVEAGEDSAELDESFTRVAWARNGLRRASSQSSMDDLRVNSTSEAGTLIRSKERFLSIDSKDVAYVLKTREAVAVMMYYNSTADPHANDIWPTLRNSGKLPARYYRLDRNLRRQRHRKSRRRPTKVLKIEESSDVTKSSPSRPVWNLPVELIEIIASYLNRDDIKSMRLVSRELNQNVSQVLFQTVVVPFNTEIYGMLGQDQALDIKGKKKAGTSNFVWKNANGDDVYNGHGLDVFRGFGAHITRYGMSFEVTEDALANPPVKTLTERHESFWGTFDWPFVEYRRFEAVAGLETAADETPRMKTAFSELTKVQELALSVDAGLGWLNGPDRSIRARILQRPPEVFGTRKEIPDRRNHAQQELWRHVEACYAAAERNIILATLYKLETARLPSKTQQAQLILDEQSEMPFVEPHIISEALQLDTSDLTVPMSFEDPEVLDRFVTPQAPSSVGILFTAMIQPADAGQLISSVIPSTLTKAQKEWLMETEWAQRAFISSYMLSIIDNPRTFNSVHTLNISRLSDRYISMLNREDFWGALPNLNKVTLMVLPCWRTIHRDEAGSVDTPRINPSSEIDSVVALLQRVISQRSQIKTLTIGWATGGEHAEGLHARNKLLQPAPLMSLDIITSQSATDLQTALLRFPFVERLTLKNCWMTPLALEEFVRLHDNLNLKHLILDSVSLTGLLRPPQHHFPAGQQVNAQGGNPGIAALVVQAQMLNAHMQAVQGNGEPQNLSQARFVHTQIQLLQTQIQALQNAPGGHPAQVAALQARLHHTTQIQAQLLFQGQVPVQSTMHGHHNAQLPQVQPPQQATPAPVAPAIPPTTNMPTLLAAEPREGSWMSVIDIITPGPNLRDFGSVHSRADDKRVSSLRSIEFISCGYARLRYLSFDQEVVEEADAFVARRRVDHALNKRSQTLQPSMLSAKWALLGEIVQEGHVRELVTLYAGWNLETGWKDKNEAKAPQFDGVLPGGTGRFTGIVRAEDRVEGATTI